MRPGTLSLTATISRKTSHQRPLRAPSHLSWAIIQPFHGLNLSLVSVLSVDAFLSRDLASGASTSLAHVNGGSYISTSGYGEEENGYIAPAGASMPYMPGPQLRERDAGVVPSSTLHLALPPEYRTVYSDSDGL